MATGQSSEQSGTRALSATDHQEIEWQFDVDDLGLVEGWLGQYSSGSSGLVITPESTVEITDTYYDTDDWRLYRAGYALRVRKMNGNVECTMKSLAPSEDNLRRRREISEPINNDRLATLKKARGPVGERSRAILGERELRRLFQIQTRRQRFALRISDPEVARMGEVSLDTSEIPAGEEPYRLKRVEVEAGADPGPELRGFVDEMRFALDLTSASLSKYEAGLYASGLNSDTATDSKRAVR